jgi:hypothetical protein
MQQNLWLAVIDNGDCRAGRDREPCSGPRRGNRKTIADRGVGDGARLFWDRDLVQVMLHPHHQETLQPHALQQMRGTPLPPACEADVAFL